MLSFENILFFFNSLKALSFKLVKARYPTFSYAGLKRLINKVDRFFYKWLIFFIFINGRFL